RGAAEARAARLQPLLPVRRLRQRLGGPLPPSARRGRPGPRAHRTRLRRQVGRHRRRFDPRRRLRAEPRRPRGGGGDGHHEHGAPRGRAAGRADDGLRRHGARGRGDSRMRAWFAGAVVLVAAGCATTAPPPGPAPGRSTARAPYDAPAASKADITIDLDERAARSILALLSKDHFDPVEAKLLEVLPAVKVAIRESNRGSETFERDLAASFDEQTR